MRKQILFCVETNQKADTDYVYISELIRHFYRDDKKISYKPIYMGSKSKYNDKKIVGKIKQSGKAYSGETHVVYFIDFDRADADQSQENEFKEIRAYCERNGYDFVFFYRDVEDVFLGKQVPDSEKVSAAARFRRKRIIEQVHEANLKSSELKQHFSNILRVLDCYFERKS